MDVDVAVRQEKNEDERSSKTRRKNIEEWKEVWEGVETLDQPKDRKKLVARRNQSETKRKKEEKKRAEEKSGKFMKNWVVKMEIKPAEMKKDVAALPTSKITDIKKKLGLWKDTKKDEEDVDGILRRALHYNQGWKWQ